MSAGAASDATAIQFGPSIGRRPRTDSWEPQKVSTCRRIGGAWEYAERGTGMYLGPAAGG